MDTGGIRAALLRLIPILTVLLASCVTMSSLWTEPNTLTSPDGRIVVDFRLDDAGAPGYAVLLSTTPATPVLRDSRLGLIRDDADFSTALRLVSRSRVERVDDRYEILTAKRRVNRYVANRRVFHLETTDGKRMEIVFQVSDDGVAFRYEFPDRNSETRRIHEEATSFKVTPGARAWLQPMQVAKTGWERTNPAYEEFHEIDIPAGTPSPTGAGWVYPALFKVGGDTWVVVSETAMRRNYCGTHLSHESPDGEYRVAFPDPRESVFGGPVNPESTLPWRTPWRIVAIGSLKTIAESMLGVDLAEPPQQPVPDWIRPGKASWSWPLLGDGQTVYDVQKRFIDYAADMHWEYCLIDSMWDQQIGYEKMRELVDHARAKNVRILLWYNSRGDWNNAPQTPRDLMLTHESRTREFARLRKMGVAGVKVDFFGGDGQSVMDYYIDIFEDAAAHEILVNCHGATLPRGWQRTYPNLMTMEAIKGLEFVTFEQRNADQEPTHATMLPFTRNVFDPMDFTPVVLDRIRRIQRRTSPAFELALSVLFTSGIQHYAEIPEGMAKAPEYVRDFLRDVPAIWDDVKFLDGYPGEHVVIARRAGDKWYLAGINGEDTVKHLKLNLAELGAARAGTLITDGGKDGLGFQRLTFAHAPDDELGVTIQPRGGFVIAFESFTGIPPGSNRSLHRSAFFCY
jgi:hypothetical protein